MQCMLPSSIMLPGGLVKAVRTGNEVSNSEAYILDYPVDMVESRLSDVKLVDKVAEPGGCHVTTKPRTTKVN